MDIRKYVSYRRAELKAEKEKLNRQILHGITAGAQIAFDQRASAVNQMLDELERFAKWQEDGEPEFTEPLTNEEHAFWLKAKSRGITIPEEIEAQL